MSPIGRACLAVLSIAFLTAGCGVVSTTLPPPTPADFNDLATTLVQRGLHIDHVVSGDAGCLDRTLIPTAISLEASGLDQASTVKLYLYVFRDRDAFERLRSMIDTCAQSYVTDPQSFESIDQSPYVMAGQGPWGQRFEAAIRDGLTKAAGDGGVGGGGEGAP
jgi:hypothetical protein